MGVCEGVGVRVDRVSMSAECDGGGCERESGGVRVEGRRRV